MNKKKLENYIKDYHNRKGFGRKFIPFYEPVSDDMKKLISFTKKLGPGGFMTAKELVSLQIILGIKRIDLLKKHNIKKVDSLTYQIFQTILTEIKNDLTDQRILNQRVK